MSNLRTGLVAAIALGTAVFAVPGASAQALAGAPQTATVTAGTAAAPQAAASAAPAGCSTGFVRQDAGVVTYKACTRGRQIRVTGSVDDTRNDKRCVWGQVRFMPSGQIRTYGDCGGPVRKFDTGWKRAGNVRVTLR